MDYSTMNKREVIEVLIQRGHKFTFLVKLPVQKLRELAASGREYNPNINPSMPSPANSPAESPVPTAPVTVQPAKPSGSSAAATIIEALLQDLTPAVLQQVEPRLQQIANEIERKLSTIQTAKPIEVRPIDLPPINVGLQHRDYESLLKMMLGTKRPIYLHGPAGSGKSTLAYSLSKGIAAVLGQPVGFESAAFGPGSQPHELLGIPGINGNPPQRTALWRAWLQPAVCLLDELDSAPDLFVSLNNGLANGRMTFADGETYSKHEHCYLIAAGNTAMTGATDQYTSRQRQDKATIDRFLFWPLHYDEQLEVALSQHEKWTKHVQRLRAALYKLGPSAPDVVISPRASIMGGELLTVCPGMTFEQVEDIVIWRGCSDDDKARVRAAAK